MRWSGAIRFSGGTEAHPTTERLQKRKGAADLERRRAVQSGAVKPPPPLQPHCGVAPKAACGTERSGETAAAESERSERK